MSSTSKTLIPIPSINFPTAIETKNIDAFLAENADKKIIVVQGLGFVGAVMSLVCANSNEDEYAVIGLILQLLKVTGKLDHLTMVFSAYC